jgi:YccS/YhfK family integral membrane protein
MPRRLPDVRRGVEGQAGEGALTRHRLRDKQAFRAACGEGLITPDKSIGRRRCSHTFHDLRIERCPQAPSAARSSYPDAVTASSTLSYRWRRIRGSDRFAECLRVFLALSGIVAYGLISQRFALVVPLMLGAIACALAETEDHWRNRINTLLVTLACFALAALCVEWLLPFPLLFAVALPLTAFLLVMLGAVSGRYATIAGATLILAVYAMIASDSLGGSGGSFFRMPLELLAGAAWYGVLSMLWSALLPQQALRHALARLFDALADYLDAKAALLAPVRGIDREALGLELARCNEQVVLALNDTRLVLIDRIGRRRPHGATALRLRLYFMAQDVHERVSSALQPYGALADAFFHSDVLFRCEYLLRLQARSCRRHADGLRLRLNVPGDGLDHAALDDVRGSIEALRRQTPAPAAQLLRALDALLRNMAAIQARLDNDASVAVPEESIKNPLLDPAPKSLADTWARIRIQLTPQSFRFRHAVRLAVALLVGYGVLRVVHPQNGYWILLTTIFVCQPSYAATYRRLLERVAGTVIGLVIGWAALRLLPAGPWQWPLVVATGVGFFATRLRRYTTATAVVTVFVVLCFNQLGHGYAVMWPRLLDTVIGAAVAALAIRLVLPDWQGRRLRHVLADTVRSDARYLVQIIGQYTSGKHDDLPYRIARRDAHNADATLSGVSFNVLREPGHRKGSELLLRFLAATQALLGHLSALGAHRQTIAVAADIDTVKTLGAITVEALERLADALLAGGVPAPLGTEPAMLEALDVQHVDDDTARLALGQLALILTQHDRLATLAADIDDNY